MRLYLLSCPNLDPKYLKEVCAVFLKKLQSVVLCKLKLHEVSGLCTRANALMELWGVSCNNSVLELKNCVSV